MKLYLTDPTSHTDKEEIQNIGDIIIKDAILDNFPIENYKKDINWIPIDLKGKNIKIQQESFLVLAGANILANRPWFNSSVWRPNSKNLFNSNYLILFGVGWWQYQGNPDFFTKAFYNKYLVKENVFHSVRDGYTKTMLEKAGIPNVINTGCPTMWKLPEVFQFSEQRPEKVIFTITDYNQDPVNDRNFIQILLQEYKTIYFFPQGTLDQDYLDSLLTLEERKRISVVARTIEAYNDVLEDNVDYIGTRLHAGIRALQKNKRAIIISIDNRAEEISKDTGLFILPRNKINKLANCINENFKFALKLNQKGIAEYKESFQNFISTK
jgi:hypothetical protein